MDESTNSPLLKIKWCPQERTCIDSSNTLLAGRIGKEKALHVPELSTATRHDLVAPPPRVLEPASNDNKTQQLLNRVKELELSKTLTRKTQKRDGRLITSPSFKLLGHLLLLFVFLVCRLGVVEGFAKLPNGNGQQDPQQGTIKKAVANWLDLNERSNVVALYGPIEDWDVSDVTNMQNVMYKCQTCSRFGNFNADISKWNTSKVINMNHSKCASLLLLSLLLSLIIFDWVWCPLTCILINICVTHVCRSVRFCTEFQFRYFKVGYECCYKHD